MQLCRHPRCRVCGEDRQDGRAGRAGQGQDIPLGTAAAALRVCSWRRCQQPPRAVGMLPAHCTGASPESPHPARPPAPCREDACSGSSQSVCVFIARLTVTSSALPAEPQPALAPAPLSSDTRQRRALAPKSLHHSSPPHTPAPGRLSRALAGSRLLWVPRPPAQLHPSCSPHIPRYQLHVGIRLLGPIHKNLSKVSVFPLCCPSLFLLLACSVLAFPLPTKLHGQEQPRQDCLLCDHGPELSQKEFREELEAIRDY